jgi:hypothetical protein
MAEPRLGREHRQFAGYPAIAAGAFARVRADGLSLGGSALEAVAQLG